MASAVEHSETEKSPDSNHSDAAHHSDSSLVADGEVDYPKGIQLLFVVLGILLSLFLAALDMVSIQIVARLR